MAGKLEVFFELNITDARAQGAAAGRNFAAGFGEAFKNATSAFKLLNPDLFKPQAGIITPPKEAPGPSGILKLLNLGPLFPIQGLRDVVGKDLAKVFAMGPLIPPGVIKGLRDQTGKDLAKVLALGDITQYDPKVKDWKQALLGGLVGLRHPYLGARMLNESGMFGGGGGGKGGLGGLFGGGGASFEKAFIALEAVKIAAYGVKEAFEILKRSFEQGFKLFTESSRLGIKSGELFNREFAAKSIGVSVADIEKYMLRQQWGKARTSLQNFGAGSSIRNMNEAFQQMIQSGERLVPVMTRISGEFYRVGFAGIQLEREWDAFVALIGEQMTGVTKDFMESLQELLAFFNADTGMASALGLALSTVISIIEKIAVGIEALFASFMLGIETIGKTIATVFVGVIDTLVALFPKASKAMGLTHVNVSDVWQGEGQSAENVAKLWKRFFTKNPVGAIDPAGQYGTPGAGGFKMPQMGAWERMGFVIGGHRQISQEAMLLQQQLQVLRQIANNGKKSAQRWNTTAPIQGMNFSPA